VGVIVTVPVDGRTARRDANRTAVLDAVLELFSAGVDATPERVAQQSGVSLRSVYRYFEDRHELTRAAIDHHLQRVGPLGLVHNLGHGTLSERLENFVAARLRLYSEVASTARVGRQRALRDPLIAERIAFSHQYLRDQVSQQFDAELSQLAEPRRTVSLNAIDTLSQFEALDFLCAQHPDGAHETLVRAIAMLLRP
jgi:AcrR family transcriptional regulator